MGMTIKANVADIVALNGGSLHTVYKMYKVKGRLKEVTYYFRKKEDALTDKFIELVDKKDGFKPCPMCGASLTMKDVYYFDEEGNECCGACDQFTHKVGIGCDCGFHYTADIEALYDEWEDLEDGKWEEKFMALANRRYKEVG